MILTLNLFNIGLLAAITVINMLGTDRWWFSAANIYLPQAIWGIPSLSLLIYSLIFSRKWLWAPLLCLAWVIGPIMGLHWSWQAQRTTGNASLRVMTCNAKFGKFPIQELIADIDRYHPDLVLLQDAGASLNSPLGKYIEGWNVRSSGQYVIASRYPLSTAQVRSILFPDENQSVLRCIIRLEQNEIVVYNVHFESPRKGFYPLKSVKKRPWYLPEAIHRLRENVAYRILQSTVLAGYVSREKDPVIVAGDLNSTDNSLACRKLQEDGLHDAFSQGGNGYGYTYGYFLLQNRLPWIHYSWMRIDHIMTSGELKCWRCWTGTDKASEHRPVFADIILSK